MPEIDVCNLNELDEDDVLRFDFKEETYAIYRLQDEEVFCSDGLCTHEQVHLEDGLVMDGVIDCPRHNGRFDIRTGNALSAPACVKLSTYPAMVVNGRIIITLPD